MRLTNNQNIFITNEKIEIEIPLKFYEDSAYMHNIIEFRNKIIFLVFGYKYGTEMEKTNIVCINKQSKEIEWIVEPCFEWEIKQIHQYMDTEATNYAMIEGLVRCKDGRPWQIEVMHLSNPDLEKLDDEELYQLREEYDNFQNYCTKYKSLHIRESDGELLEGADWDKYETSGGIAYEDLSEYPEDECIIVTHAGAYWYELDHNNGKIIPAFVDRRMYK